MKAAFYAGASGLSANQHAMNNIGNNIANVNTTGYKTQGTQFETLLYNQMYVNSQNKPLSGNGVASYTTGLNFTQSSLIPTEYPLDFAISGDGLFAVEQNGKVLYTRDGTFGVGLYGGTAYLTTQSGGFVLDSNNQRIELPKSEGEEQFNFDDVGKRIGIFRFDNPSGLIPAENNLYAASATSGVALAGIGSTLIQGALEKSNTSLVDEMVDMIAAQRSYQVCAKVVQTSDENEQVVNNLRK